MTRITSQRAQRLAYIARNPGTHTAEVDRACRTARGGHKWMYAAIDRDLRAGLLRRVPATLRANGACGLALSEEGEALLQRG